MSDVLASGTPVLVVGGSGMLGRALQEALTLRGGASIANNPSIQSHSSSLWGAMPLKNVALLVAADSRSNCSVSAAS